jgi:hypothetical protein
LLERPPRLSQTKFGLVAVALVTLSGTGSAQASAQASSPVGAATLLVGTFQGTLVVSDDARDTTARARPVSGRAQWRLELDSLDWRRKVTIRIVLDGPDRAEYVIRTADSTDPGRVLYMRNNASSHADRRYFTGRISLLGASDPRRYTDFSTVRDSVTFVPGYGRASGNRTLRGTVDLQGYREFSAPKKGEFFGQQATRILRGSFAATFDPRPEPVPRTMTAAVQRGILDRALFDFGINYANQLMHLGQGDSTLDNRLARGYLASRWGNAATVDSIDVDYRHVYVRLRGRYLPIRCELDGGRTAGSVCWDR